MEDEKIVSLFTERSEAAVKETDIKYRALLMHIAKNIVGNNSDAEECVSDTFLALWNTIPPEKPYSLKTYACRILRNIAVKKYHYNTAKKRNSHYDTILDELAPFIPDTETTESEYAAGELGELLNRFLKETDRDSRLFFIRRYWYAEQVKTIAEKTGAGEHYISVKLSRTRQKLRKFLEKEGFTL